MLLRPRLCVAAAVVVSCGLGIRGAAQSPSQIAEILSKASAYVLKFEQAFSNVVCEEIYQQRMLPTGQGQRRFAMDRTLRSDFTLVQVPGGTEWLPFRDVYEVDGRAVRDREDRLSKLFLTPSVEAIQRARAIVGESNRYNIGGLSRTINVPVLAFEVLRPEMQTRFQFAAAKRDRGDAASVDVISFRETTRPSFVKGPNGGDMPSTGRLWIDRETGTVRKTELIIDTSIVRAQITTTFGDEPGFAVAVPVAMDEHYTDRGKPVVTGVAKYSKFRKFGIDVKTEMER
jgi:hypothetical protein